MKQRRRANTRKRADQLFSLYIRKRDKTCTAAGVTPPSCKGNLQCAHIHSRGYGLIRHCPENATALCAAHHFWFTHHPIEWRQFVESMWPGRWDVLVRRALADAKPDPKAAVKALELLLAEVGA